MYKKIPIFLKIHLKKVKFKNNYMFFLLRKKSPAHEMIYHEN